MIVGEKHYICIVMNINRLSKSVIIKTYYDMKFKICLFLLSILKSATIIQYTIKGRFMSR